MKRTALCLLLTVLLLLSGGCQLQIPLPFPGEPEPSGAAGTAPDDSAPAVDPAAQDTTDAPDAAPETSAEHTSPLPPSIKEPPTHRKPDASDRTEKTVYDESAVYLASTEEYPVIDVLTGGPYGSADAPATHRFQYPAVTGTTENIAAFNQKLASFAARQRDKAKNGKAEEEMYSVVYDVGVCGSVAAVLMHLNIGIQYSEYYSEVVGFYFDLDADRELTYAEYLDRMGVSERDIAEALAENEEFRHGCEDFDWFPTVDDFLDKGNDTAQILTFLLDGKGGAKVAAFLGGFYMPTLTFDLPGFVK